MRYSISEPVSFEEATPRGLLSIRFKAGEIEVEPGSDEQYAIEYVLIPAGYAEPVSDRPKPKRLTKAEREAAKASEAADLAAIAADAEAAAAANDVKE